MRTTALILTLLWILPAEARSTTDPDGEAQADGCPDPVAGRWRARTRRSTAPHWHEFVLLIRRDPQKDYLVDVEVRAWSGGPKQATPPDRGVVRVYLSGWAALRGDTLEVRATAFDAGRSEIARSRYALDAFSGPLDRRRSIYRARNHDARAAAGRPYDFERISCSPGAETAPAPTPASRPRPPALGGEAEVIEDAATRSGSSSDHGSSAARYSHSGTTAA